MKPTPQLFTSIAREHLCIETLETRNSDSLDFHDVSVIGVKRALQAAYQAGLRAGAAPQPLILLQDISLAMHDGGMRKPKGWLESIDRTIAEAMAAATIPGDERNLPTRFDAYEVHGVREYEGATFGQGKYSEQVPDEEAEFWSLYGHIPGRGIECIGDFETRRLAEQIYARITGRRYGRQSGEA
jgi:hypothetical protein